MGKRQAEKDSRFSAHEAWYSHETSPHGSDIVILENVTEYRQSIVRGHFKSPLYEMQTACIDPRLFGEGSACARLYCVIYKTRKFSWDESMSLAEFLSMLKMRPQMSALSYFWQPLPKSILSKTQAMLLFLFQSENIPICAVCYTTDFISLKANNLPGRELGLLQETLPTPDSSRS